MLAFTSPSARSRALATHACAAKLLLHRSLARREAEGGAALFLVVMVITMLSAIGIFAMRSASLVDVATGYNRQGVQANLLAEYAARATATYMTRGDDFVAKAASDRVGGCAKAFLDANPQASCTIIHDDSLRDEFSAGADGLSGRLGLNNGPISVRGVVASEVLVPAASLPRAGFESAHFKQLTVTSTAHIFPVNATSMTSSCSAGAREALSQQSIRSHILVPQFVK